MSLDLDRILDGDSEAPTKPAIVDDEDRPYGEVLAPDRKTVRYTSASAIQTADANTYGGCLRAWWLKYKGGHKTEQTLAMRRGTKELHEPIEHYYKTGDRVFGPLILPIVKFMPARSPELLIEHDIARPLGAPTHYPDGRKTPIDLALAPLRIEGVAFVGKIDVVNPTGYYINSDGKLVREDTDRRVVEVKDWKSCKGPEYAKKADDLRKTRQMNGYGKWAIEVFGADMPRLSHVYTRTKGPAEGWKVTDRVEPEEIDRGWEYTRSVVRQIIDAAKYDDVEQIPGNPKSCDSFGKGCPHKISGVCSIGRTNAETKNLTKLFGARGAALVTTGARGAALALTAKEQPSMSLADKLKLNTNATAPVSTPIKPPEGIGTKVSANTDALADLIAEEESAMQQSPTANTPIKLTAEMLEAFEAVGALQRGWPMMTGDVAEAYVAWRTTKGESIAFTPGAALGPSGALGKLKPLDTVETLLLLGKQAIKIKADQAAKAAAVEVPKSELVPETVKVEVKTETPPTASVPVVEAPKPEPVVESKPEPVAVAETKSEPVAVVQTIVQPIEQPAPKKRGPKPKNYRDTVEAPPAVVIENVDLAREGARIEITPVPTTFYINAVPSMPFTPADAWAGSLVKCICDEYQVLDPRLAPKTCEPLAFNAWRATLGAVVRESILGSGGMPACPAGNVVLFTRDDITTEIAAAIMASGAPAVVGVKI